MRRSIIVAVAVPTAIAIGGAGIATGAGAADGPSAHAAKAARSLKADSKGKLKFNKTQLTAPHGKVTLVMTNPSSSGKPHAIGVSGHGIDKDGKTAAPGKKSTVTVTLKKGTYNFYCPVDGHRSAGMKGKLKIT
jgi:plastocyanin